MAHQLNWRICGVRVHGVGDWLYVVDESLPGGGNAILTILFDVLDILFSEGHVKVAKNCELILAVRQLWRKQECHHVWDAGPLGVLREKETGSSACG